MIPFFVQIKCHMGKSYQVANALADAEIAETIRSWLNDAELPPAPHRLIVEGLADMERALRAQARDRTAGQAARRH